MNDIKEIFEKHAIKMLDEMDGDDLCKYCKYSIKGCSGGVTGGPYGPIFPPCADTDIKDEIDLDDIIAEIEEEVYSRINNIQALWLECLKLDIKVLMGMTALSKSIKVWKYINDSLASRREFDFDVCLSASSIYDVYEKLDCIIATLEDLIAKKKVADTAPTLVLDTTITSNNRCAYCKHALGYTGWIDFTCKAYNTVVRAEKENCPKFESNA